MIKKYLMQKTRNIAIVFLVCLGALSMQGISSAHALQPTFEGDSGTCRWQYARLSDKKAGEEAYVLRIFPFEGRTSADLQSWEAYTPPWRSRAADNYRKKTTRIEIEGKGLKRPVSAVTCKGMFCGFSKVETADLSGLDTSSVRDMNRMFYQCEKLSLISGIDGFNTLSVGDMREMFSHCYALRSLEIETWATNAVTRMDQLFFKCYALESLDLGEWDVSGAMSMEKMFAHCHALTTVGDIGKWEVIRVTTTSDMFHGCSNLVELDMSNWVLPDFVMMRGMFHKTERLKSIRIGHCVKVRSNAEFSSAGSKIGSGTCWVQVADGTASNPRGRVFPSNDALRSFHNAIRTQDNEKFEHYVRLKICRGTSGDCVWEYLPSDRKDLRGNATYLLRIHPSPGRDSGTLGRWNETPPWRDHEEYYTQTTEVEIKSERNVRTPVRARTCLNMFSSFMKLKDIDVSGLDVSNVTDMRKMFQGCRALTSLDLGAWNTSANVRMKKMFEQTLFLRTIRLGESFRIKDEAMLSDAGSKVGTHWVQVASGSVYGPAGRAFASTKYLALFHHDKTKRNTDTEQYTRADLALFVAFCKNAHDARGAMDSQLFGFSEEKPLTKNAYERTGYEFDGWRDDQHVSYKDEQLFKNTIVEFYARKVLFAQWKPIPHTLAFNANVPATETPIAVPENITVDHDQDAKIPAGGLFRDGYEFLWWSTKADGTGERYYPDTEIKGVTGDIVLYAQWQKRSADAYGVSEQTDQKKDLELSGSSVTQESTRQAQESTGQIRETMSQAQESTGQIRETMSQAQESTGQARETMSQTQEPTGQTQEPISHTQEPTGQTQEPISQTQEAKPIPRKRSYASGWYKRDGNIFYNKNGKKLTGWHELKGTIQNPSSPKKNWFYFGADGAALTGQHELVGGLNQGMHWFYFDETTGEQIRGWKYIDYQDKWCCYSLEDGAMLKGQHELQGGDKGGKNWFYFDEVTGAELRNCWKEIPSQKKTCYYGGDGVMYKGRHEIDGKLYYFDEVTGALACSY